MRMYYIFDSEDIEHSFGLFEKEEDAQFVCERIDNLADAPDYKRFETDEVSEDGVYYFIVNSDEWFIENKCFATKEKAIAYAEENEISPYEIHGHKLNSIDSGNDTPDDNGDIAEPDEDDMDSSFYNLALEMKENGINFVYFVQDYAEGGWG